MLGFFERGQIVDLAVIFISRTSGLLIDPIDPTVEISHYSGVDENIVLPETAITKILTRPVGYFTYEFIIPNTFNIDEVYYVRWRGLDPSLPLGSGKDIVEETFKVVAPSGGNCCGLIPRFNKC